MVIEELAEGLDHYRTKHNAEVPPYLSILSNTVTH